MEFTASVLEDLNFFKLMSRKAQRTADSKDTEAFAFLKTVARDNTSAYINRLLK